MFPIEHCCRRQTVCVCKSSTVFDAGIMADFLPHVQNFPCVLLLTCSTLFSV